MNYETRFRWISFQFRASPVRNSASNGARRNKNYETYTAYLLNNFCKDVAEIEKKDADLEFRNSKYNETNNPLIMIITYHGIQCFKIQFGSIVLAFDPISRASSFKTPPRFGADLALISTNHPDMNGTDQVSNAGKEPFVIQGPGEYEIKDVFIKGLSSRGRYGLDKKNPDYAKSGRLNTIYSVLLENMNIVFLGALGESDLSEKTGEAIGETDILFLPIGGDGVLNASEAAKIAVKLEPKIIIPMNYGEKDSLKAFLKEMGEEGVKPTDKLTVKKKDVEGREGSVVLLAT
ncbi:MAG: MBL fold metallo-hydrolase [bacterium]|nr:MBL fold metallo-hydrolase [bacterium]